MVDNKFSPSGAEEFRVSWLPDNKGAGESVEQDLPKKGIIFSEADKLRIQGDALKAARTRGTSRVTKGPRG